MGFCFRICWRKHIDKKKKRVQEENGCNLDGFVEKFSLAHLS